MHKVFSKSTHLLALLTALLVVCTPPATAVALEDDPAARDEALELPLLLAEGRLIVPVRVVGAGTQFFILDTAASSSVISSRLRERLDIDPSRVRRDTVQGAGGQAVMEKVLLPGIGVGGETFTDVDPVVLDFSAFREYDGRPVEGILGTDVLRHYDVRIDVPGRTIRLLPSAARAMARAMARGNDSVIAFVSRSAPGFVEFELLVNGQPVRGVLDTGASRSVFNGQAAEALGVSRQDPALRRQARGSRGITGGCTESDLYTFEVLQVGARTAPCCAGAQ